MPPQSAGPAESLAAIKDWSFKLGPGFVVGIGNGLILGYLMYRSGPERSGPAAPVHGASRLPSSRRKGGRLRILLWKPVELFAQRRVLSGGGGDAHEFTREG
jgi:hypothetical protein